MSAVGSDPWRRARTALCGVALLGAASCSFTRPEITTCSSSVGCREAFGSGFVCGGDGYCEKAAPSPRCQVTFPEDLLTRPESYPNAIVIGSLMDRSVITHQARENAIRLATTHVTEGGGLQNRPFGVVFCDIAKNSQYDSRDRGAAAVQSGLYLADVIGVPAIIGPSASTDALAVFEALGGRDVVMISPSATSPELSGIDAKNPTDENPGRFWRTAPPDTLQGDAIAIYLQQKQVKDIELIHELGAYGEGLATVFEKSFQSIGGNTHRTVFSSSSERDAAVVAAGKSFAPWVLFVSSQTTDASAFLIAASSLSVYASKNLFLTDSAANADFLSAAAGASAMFPRVRGSRFSVPAGNVYEQFRASYNAAFQVEANSYSYVAHAYDATWLAFYGSARSLGQEGRVHGLGIARGLRHVSLGKALPIVPVSWGEIGKELSLGGDVDVNGASGALDFDPLSEETEGPVDIWQIAPSGTSIVVEQTLSK